ncbi:AP2/ERF and B3 domain-containing transcription repressor TEM1-like [Tripterygium wilfordii]|uniref:AP2/ERF and B3 domain-containing transcription repressor TEM1-like n=1 Tax=Tripterygium wilfordii TaxID=458696 RepID=UPI0018F86143|nr:AP2/ERF and B3 domain-containing transcription repressor TEM1-like [Tripterygium wilfordii]
MAILFSKLLKKTDVEKRLLVPAKSLKSLSISMGVNHRGMDLQVIDANGKLWSFRCLVRKKNYLKPVLSRNWVAFVRANNLQVGDRVTFHQELRQCRIQVEKPMKIFGVVFGAEPDKTLLLGSEDWKQQ